MRRQLNLPICCGVYFIKHNSMRVLRDCNNCGSYYNCSRSYLTIFIFIPYLTLFLMLKCIFDSFFDHGSLCLSYIVLFLYNFSLTLKITQLYFNI